MGPMITNNCGSDGRLAAPVSCSQFRPRDIVDLTQRASFHNLRRCEDCSTISFTHVALWMLPSPRRISLGLSISSLPQHIHVVIEVRPKKEMTRITTARVIAPMQYQHTVWYRSKDQGVRKSMGVPLPSIPSHPTISPTGIRLTRTGPFPARIKRNLIPNLSPKPSASVHHILQCRTHSTTRELERTL